MRTDSRGPWRALGTIWVAVLAVALLAPSTAGAAIRSEFFGIVQGQFDAVGQLDDTDLQGMEAARIRTDRFELAWRSVEPTLGTFNWTASDHFVGALASHGIRAAPFIWKSPSWIAKGPNTPPIDTAAHEQAWRDFLEAAVARYGQGGSYWGSPYHREYGAGAARLPIRSWQIWNEPNLRKFFDPGGSNAQLARHYAELLRISSAAIKSADPDAQVVLAGSPGYPPRGGPRAWEFLNQLYTKVPKAKDYFDVAALHPYASDLTHVRIEIERFRAVMNNHGDRTKPLWLTELGWGSDPPDQFGINQGPVGQQQLLSKTYQMVLENRSAWNVQRLFWFLWRDPDPDSSFAHRCSFCASAGLLGYNRTRKRSYSAFAGFVADTTPPTASFASGPAAGSVINDPTPVFSFGSSDPGSTFECRIDGAPFKPCSSPYTTPRLSDGDHKLSVQAVDAPGNVSEAKGRPFTVDTTAPAVTVTSGPANGSATSAQSASFGFSINDPSATLTCKLDAGSFNGCSSPFSTPTLGDGIHAVLVRARDRAGNVGGAGIIWTVDTVAPTVTISSGPDEGSTSEDPRPSFGFDASEPGVSFKCQFNSDPPAPCSSPYSVTGRLPNGSSSFSVVGTDRAGNLSPTVTRNWTTDAPPLDVWITTGPANGAVIANHTPSFGFASSDSASSLEFRCRIDGRGFEECSPPWPIPWRRDGQHRFSVKAIDGGAESQVVARSFTVDTTGPTTTISSGPANGSASSDPIPSFGFSTSEPGGTFRCRLDSGGFAPCSSPHSIGPLADGRHAFAVRAIDALGNPGAVRSRSFTIDTAAPRLRIKGPSKVATTKRRTSVTFVLKASEQVALECRLTQKRFEPCSPHYRTPKLGDGAHTLKVRATDRAGNVANREKQFEIVSTSPAKARRAAHRRG